MAANAPTPPGRDGRHHMMLDWFELPPFAELSPADVGPAAAAVVAEGDALLAAIESDPPTTWDGLMGPLEALSDRLGRAWSLPRMFLSCRDSPAWREAWSAVEGDLTRLQSRLAQSRPLYDALVALRDRSGDALSAARRRLLDAEILEMRLGGVALDDASRARFQEVAAELAQLSTRFAQTALDSRKAWSRVLTDAAAVDGMSRQWRQLTAASARAAGHGEATAEDGPWRVTLDRAIAGPVLQHAHNRSLREDVRRAMGQVGCDGTHDNAGVVQQILELRHEQAGLLGFASYAELSLARKMASGVDAVDALKERVVAAASTAAAAELEALSERAQQAGAPEAEGLSQWDVGYWSEREKEEKVGITDDDLRPYFPLDMVLDGLFNLVDRLFGAAFVAAPDIAGWHPDVQAFRLYTDGADTSDPNAHRAVLYIDPYSRPEEKRAGAWMMPLTARSAHLGRDGVARRSVASICCNQSPPVDGKPSLMAHREVVTLFHEMGHALHHMLTVVEDARQAGISGVEWDAVEVPSLFLESWAWHRPTLQRLTRHVDTGETLPDDIIDRLIASRTHAAGGQLLAQSAYISLDMGVHRVAPEADADALMARGNALLDSVRPLPALETDRMLCSFGHLFAGGYAAGYYSYMWAGVLARDAFAAFTDLDGDADAEAALGRRWRDELLARGGSSHPLALFEAFRGRGPDEAAMLAWYGVSAA